MTQYVIENLAFTAYYLAHWFFAYKYWTSAQKLSHFKLRDSQLTPNILVCFFIVSIEAINLFVDIQYAVLYKAAPEYNYIVFQVVRWIEPTFILIDCVVLLVALLRMRRVFFAEKDLFSNER